MGSSGLQLPKDVSLCQSGGIDVMTAEILTCVDGGNAKYAGVSEKSSVQGAGWQLCAPKTHCRADN